MKKGFTLIELLVVVLIIGILASVALPQYETAVDKARYSALMPLVKSVRDAQEIYYMANGFYAADWTGLDIDFPAGGTWTGNNKVEYPDGRHFNATTAYGGSGVVGYVKTGDEEAYYAMEFSNGEGEGIIRCGGTGPRAIRVCKSLGGKEYTVAGSVTYRLK